MEWTVWAAVERVAPELVRAMEHRVRVMQRIDAHAPIGRRALAQAMGQSERTLRTELDYLKQLGLVATSSSGVSLTPEGKALLGELEPLVAEIAGRSDLAWRVSALLRIPRVIVVEGDADEDAWVTDRIGQAGSDVLAEVLQDGDIIAVTGGTTVAAVAKSMSAKPLRQRITVVPARGTVGEIVAYQANTIASELAAKLGGSSVLLQISDSLSQKALEQLLDDPYIQERLPIIRQATVVVHGVGDALAMARRRHATEEEIKLLEAREAKAEAFGHYFNARGEVVYAMRTIGLRLDDVARARVVIAVAGGQKKAQAIASVANAYRIDVLVTDEGAARRILQLETPAGKERVEHGSEGWY